MSKQIWNSSVKAATDFTKQENRKFAERFGIDLDYTTNEEVELANASLLRSAEGLDIPRTDGGSAWNQAQYFFLKANGAADTVQPSLWLNAKANLASGVFEVLPDKIYQVRGLDIANLSLVRSKTGWIVLDTTSSVEAARKGLELVEEALGEPVRDRIRAVIVSHSHGDHYGGLRGVVDQENVGHAEDGKIPIIVPEGFDAASVKESIYAGTAMSRRAKYQFGNNLEAGITGRVSAGLGLGMTSGTISYIPPTDFIHEDGIRVIDGLEVEFQLTPGTEAPAEMNNYFPEYRAFWAAENCTATLHNLYPIRGAKLRDSANWWRFTEIARERYGKRADIVFQSHHWPRANTPENPNRVEKYLRNTAAIYKFIHDQTLLYANMGKTAKEIARELQLPDALEKNWYTRPYYGTVEINAREVYEFYLGFYNGNPNELNALTEYEEAKLLVDYAGSEECALELAAQDFSKGNYRRAAKGANAVVYVNPDNEQARYLTADAFEQLAYQAESSIWRNAYLEGAYELRHGTAKRTVSLSKQTDMLAGMNTQMLLDYLGIVTDGNQIEDEDTAFRLQILRDGTISEEFLVHVYHGTILYYEGETHETQNYVRLPEGALQRLICRELDAIRSVIETNVIDVLERIEHAVISLPDYSSFPLMGLKE
ncbi:MAG: MBL fold metallo-hydrolase [Clostridia bacterium]|nr:MBL fold metallo-hydrolase [Clostridia bacterium]